MADYDVIVIGGGPAGYTAAIRCAQLGLRTACIDRWRRPDGAPALGGTCLNAGCIPSKALLDSSELYRLAREELAEHGVKVGEVRLDLRRMMARKEAVVRRLTDGIATLFAANGIEHLHGTGRLLSPRRVELAPAEGGEARALSCGHVILAPGSEPIELEVAPVDGERVVDSSGALAFASVPRRLGIIGAGVIGLELGSVWRRLGSEEVVLLEAQETFLPACDHRIAQEAFRLFTAQGLDIRLGARVTGTRTGRRQVTVRYEDGTGAHELRVDRLIVAVGRRPATEGIAAPECELVLDERGAVHVDELCRTSLPGVWAIGDAVRGPMLAHKGAEEGICVAEQIGAGRTEPVDLGRVPAVIYTHPEIAWVGATEQALKAEGVAYRVGTFPFAASGRAQALGQTAGLVKVLASAEDDTLLGVHVIGPWASELIAEAVLAMEFGGSSEDLARIVHAHPTLSEAVHEAAMSVERRAIHLFARRG